MTLLLLTAAMLIPPDADPRRAAELAPEHFAKLTCGQGRFRIVSRQWIGRDTPLAPYVQTLTVGVGKARRTIGPDFARRITVGGHAVRLAYIVSWACVRASTGRHYLTVSYACAVDPGENDDCGGDKEWFRWIDVRGRRVDAAIPRSGSTRDRFEEELGLAEASDRGIAMKPTLPD